MPLIPDPPVGFMLSINYFATPSHVLKFLEIFFLRPMNFKKHYEFSQLEVSLCESVQLISTRLIFNFFLSHNTIYSNTEYYLFFVLDEYAHHRPVHLAYHPPVFLSQQTSHQQKVNSTFLSEQISTSHPPLAKRT
jgi:hypothetical protein